MNREILFRGKHIYDGRWVEGWYCGKTCDTLFSKARESAQIVDDNLYWHEVISSTVGQFTGLTDKFNEKVFEGDYVYDEADEEIGIVEFDEGEFVVRFGDVIDGNRFADVIASCHVIGNIHDVPDLMGGDGAK